MLFVGGRFADDLFGFIGLGSTAANVWSIVRWPGAFAVTTLIFALIYYVTPDVKHRSFKWITPGAVVGVLLWLAASVGFSFYLSNFASLNALYGAFTGAIVLVFWLWLTNVALLFGAELNAAIERSERILLTENPAGKSAQKVSSVRAIGRARCAACFLTRGRFPNPKLPIYSQPACRNRRYRYTQISRITTSTAG